MSTVSTRLAAIQTGLRPLLDFLNHSEHAKRIGDPTICDFVFGNPHEMPLTASSSPSSGMPSRKTRNGSRTRRRFRRPSEQSRTPFVRGPASISSQPTSTSRPGTFAALAIALRATVDPGDEVIFISPPWFFYESMIAVMGATPVRVTLSGPGFRLDAAAVEAAITPRTRAIIVNSPQNPTGRIYSRRGAGCSRGGADARVAAKRPANPLLSDESYNRILFDGRSFMSPALAYPHTLVLYTYGKQLLAPGERLGYVAISPSMRIAAKTCERRCSSRRSSAAGSFPTRRFSAPCRIWSNCRLTCPRFSAGETAMFEALTGARLRGDEARSDVLHDGAVADRRTTARSPASSRATTSS